LEVDLAVGQEGAHDVHGLLRRGQRLPDAQSIPYCAIRPKLPVETTASIRPFVSSSSVASCCTISVGLAQEHVVTLGPKRIRSVLSAAAANSTAQSLCQVSSTGVARVEAELVRGPDHVDRSPPAGSRAACSS
jgi:hypothetical protein